MFGIMAVSKPRAQAIVTETFNLLCARTTAKEIFAQNGEKWGISKRTFDRYMKEASQRYTEHQGAIQIQLMKESEAYQKERVKDSLLNKEDILKKLMDIVNGGKRDSDRINACKLICEIEGFKAPIKNELDINNVTPIFMENPLIDGLNNSLIYNA